MTKFDFVDQLPFVETVRGRGLNGAWNTSLQHPRDTWRRNAITPWRQQLFRHSHMYQRRSWEWQAWTGTRIRTKFLPYRQWPPALKCE
jgi:hypothetical protein